MTDKTMGNGRPEPQARPERLPPVPSADRGAAADLGAAADSSALADSSTVADLSTAADLGTSAGLGAVGDLGANVSDGASAAVADEPLAAQLRTVFGERVRGVRVALGEVTLEILGEHQAEVCATLRADPRFAFESLIDLCGVDFQTFGDGAYEGRRFAVVTHLLSYRHNRRLRLRSFCADDDYPLIETVSGVWPAANWYEREAFDLFGIVFTGHPDLRRILTDYGFVGHPFRKDFPISGYVEMRYDPEQRRVLYQPVTIEPRDNVPRVVREEGYGPDRMLHG